MSTSTNPKLKAYLTLVPHSLSVVEIRWGGWNPTSATIEAQDVDFSLLDLLERFDGASSVAALSNIFGVEQDKIAEIVETLASIGALDEGSADPSDVYFSLYANPSFGTADGERSSTTRNVMLITDVSETSAFRTSIEEMGLTCVIKSASPLLRAAKDIDWKGDGLSRQHWTSLVSEYTEAAFVVVHTEFMDPAFLLALNAALYSAAVNYVFSIIDGPFIYIGPTVEAGRRGCFECLESRVLASIRSAESYVKFKRHLAIRGGQNPKSPATIGLSQLALQISALEAIHATLSGKAFTRNKVLSLYIPTFEFSFHEILPVAQCSTCGSERYRDDEELYFRTYNILR